MASNWEIIPYIILGIISGFVALAFVKAFFKCEDLFGDLRIPGYVKPAVGGLIVGLIGAWYFNVMGIGYGGSYGVGGVFMEQGAVDKVLLGEIGLATLSVLLVLKIIATSVSLGSGGSGGTFAPSLFIGSVLGGAFGIMVHRLFPTITAPSVADASGAYALVGMGALFAAVVHGPITAIILLFEMTRNYTLILPLMTAVVVSVAIARAFTRETIYTIPLVRRGIDIHREEETDALGITTVGEVMTRDFPTVSPSMTVSELLDKLHETGYHGFPLVDERGAFSGIVTLQDVEQAMSRKAQTLPCADIATRSPIVAYPDQSVREALAQLGGREVGQIPVVDRSNPTKLLGVLRRHDIVKAYMNALPKRSPHRTT